MAGEGRKPFTLEDLAKVTSAKKPDGQELKFQKEEYESKETQEQVDQEVEETE